MKHWDLTPKQFVTLNCTNGITLEARYLFSDTVRACFLIYDGEQFGEFRQFQILDDGDLKTSPTREDLLNGRSITEVAGAYMSPPNFAAAMRRMKRWQIRELHTLSPVGGETR